MLKLMNAKEWADVEATTHYRRSENWGDPMKVSQSLISGLVILREIANAPVYIHCAYATDGHSPNSMHYQGLAADLHIGGGKTVADMVWLARRARFTGIGAYPYWHNPGIHVDCRDLVGKPNAFWIEPDKFEGTGEYKYFLDINSLLNALEGKGENDAA